VKNVLKKLSRLPSKLLFLLSYFLLRHNKAVSKLLSIGLTNIRIFNIRKWRGSRANNIRRYYYTAQYNQKKCFVKLSNDSTILNEIFVNNYITRCGIDCVPKLLFSKTNYDKDFSVLILEFKSDMRNFEIPKDEKTFESVCEEFLHIYNKFSEFNIIHGDINKSNLLLDSENRITVIDFGIGRISESDSIRIVRKTHCGTYFQTMGSYRIYDDAYSFLMMLDDCGLPPMYKNKECYKKIESLIGTNSYKVSM